MKMQKNLSRAIRKVVLGSSLVMMGSWGLTSNVFAMDEELDPSPSSQTQTEDVLSASTISSTSTSGWCEEINNGGLERALFQEVGGENRQIGEVHIKKRYDCLLVSFDITEPGLCMTGTKVTITSEDSSIPPITDSKLGLKCMRTFLHQVNVSSFSTTCINGGEVIAHLAQYNAPVGSDVTYKVSRNGQTTSYFDGTIIPKCYLDGTTLPQCEPDGTTPISDWLQYPAWCVDIGHYITRGVEYEGCTLHSTRQADGLGKIWQLNLVDKPQNLDLVNYVLNQRATYEAHFASTEPVRNVRRFEIQAAIWALIDDNADSHNPWGVPDQVVVDYIVADAMANGEGFVPNLGQIAGVLAECYNDRCKLRQVTLIQAEWEPLDPPSDAFDGPLTCLPEEPPAHNDEWRTHTQGGWGTRARGNNPGTFRDANFDGAFPDGLSIGMAGNSASFNSSRAIKCFLPQGGKPGTLDQDYTTYADAGSCKRHCRSTNAGVLAGQTVALTLNVTFDEYCKGSADCTFSGGDNSILLKQLVVVSGSGTECDGWTVEAILNTANAVLAGTDSLSPSAINKCVSKVNENFVKKNKGYLTTP